MNTDKGDQIRADSCAFVVRHLNQSSGFALVVALVMVALMAVIAVGVLTTVSVERGTAASYNSRYQADLAVQNGLQAAAKTLAASPNGTSPVTGKDTFLVVRSDCNNCAPDANGNRPAYYYLAQPAPSPSTSITYYPLFSASTDPSNPGVQTGTINLAAPGAPTVPTPAPPGDSNPSDPTAAWNAAGTQRLPTLYSWQQPSSPSGPSVKWVEMRDPQDAPSPAPHNLPYTRYSYWVEDLDGYLDASQVGGQPRSIGTQPGEIAMFTIFDPSQQTDPGNTYATTQLIPNRSLLFTVPTLQQLAPTTPDVTGPNLAVRLGVDNRWGSNAGGEQNLIPLGYGYLTEGQVKSPINPVSQLGLNGNQIGPFAAAVSNAMPNFENRTITGAQAPSAQTHNYLTNLTANLLDYAFPLDAPTEFMPPGNPDGHPAYRGIGAYPFVVSLYDLNNWVQTVQVGSTYQAVIETTTYVQLWNPHNFPTDGLGGAVMFHYQNSDKLNVNGTTKTLSPPPDTTIIFTANPDPANRNPVIVSPLFEIGTIGKPFNYQIKPAIGYQDPKGKIKPNEYRVVVLPGPTPACTPSGHNPYTYSATGLPPGLNLHGGGRFAGLINGTPTLDSNRTYANGYEDYTVAISANAHSCGVASATLTIRIYK
jgi:type II secretory pathway pseudopilin PulG